MVHVCCVLQEGNVDREHEIPCLQAELEELINDQVKKKKVRCSFFSARPLYCVQ